MKQKVKRFYRYFKVDTTKEDIVKTVSSGFDPAQYAHTRTMKGIYCPADTDALVGRDFFLRCDERDYGFSFKALNEVVFSERGEPDKTCYCNVKTLDGEIFLVNFLVPGYATSRQVTLIADTKTGCGTVCDAHIGTEYTNIDVGREFFFGRFDGEFEGGELHGYTTEMVGKAIEWSYDPDSILQKHIYNSNLFYTYTNLTAGGAWMASNPADYVKIRDNIYVFSFVEERQGGVQALFLMDLNQMHDVGCFYSAGHGHLSSACIGAVGKYADPTTIF